MNTLYFVIANAGDGSSYLRYFIKEETLEHVQSLADSGDDRYASGDGLQLHKFEFEDYEELCSFVNRNKIILDEVEEDSPLVFNGTWSGYTITVEVNEFITLYVETITGIRGTAQVTVHLDPQCLDMLDPAAVLGAYLANGAEIGLK